MAVIKCHGTTLGEHAVVPDFDESSSRMTDPTPLDLEPIKQRLAAATAGPWAWVPRWACATSSFLRLDNFEAADVIAVETECVSEGDHRTTLVVDEPNAAFIAHSRTDIPALIAEVERLREEAELYEGMKEGVTVRIGDLEAENEKLRRILSHVPGRVAIKAKEDAGFPNFIHASST